MEYIKFKGKEYKGVMNEENFFLFLLCMSLCLIVEMWILYFISFDLKCVFFEERSTLNLDKQYILILVFLITSMLFIFTLHLLFEFSAELIRDFILIKKTETIRERLLIDELPTNIDLFDYFKQREIELLESEVKGDFDLLKSMYLRDEVLNEL